jgi:glycosyltransferase involved in cell wall biosynthesis
MKKKSLPCTGDNEDDCLSCLSDWLYLKKGPKLVYQALRYLLPAELVQNLKTLFIKGLSRNSNTQPQKSLIASRKEYMRSLIKLVDLFISPSEFMRRRATEFGIPETKNILVHLGIAKNNLPAVQTAHSRVCFGFIGTILPAKGLHILIAAFNKITDKSAELHIYGKMRPYRGFEAYPAYIRRSLQNKNVFFKDAFSHERLAEVLSGIDVLVVPSLWNENAPLVILEAFLAKVPVIASRIGGIPELISDGKNGLLFKAGDSDDLLRKISHILCNRGILDYFKANITQVKDISDNARELETIYKSLG